MREELKTTKSHPAFTKSAHQHDVRKKAKELDRMKDRLHKMTQEKSGSGKHLGMTLLNPLPKSTTMVLDKKISENPV